MEFATHFQLALVKHRHFHVQKYHRYVDLFFWYVSSVSVHKMTLFVTSVDNRQVQVGNYRMHMGKFCLHLDKKLIYSKIIPQGNYFSYAKVADVLGVSKSCICELLKSQHALMSWVPHLSNILSSVRNRQVEIHDSSLYRNENLLNGTRTSYKM